VVYATASVIAEEVAKIDTDIRSLVEARKYGKGVTDAVALDQEPEGMTSEGQIEVLRKRRVLLGRQIDELEEQARHNAIIPGELRTEYGPEEPETTSGRKLNREARELENTLAQEQEHLERARKDAELLQRDQQLKAQQEYSNPEPPSRRNKPSDLSVITTRLTEKQAEVQEEEQKVAELEDRLKDLIQNSPAEREPDAVAESESTNLENDHEEKTEAYWRKKFAALDYQIKTAQTELDICSGSITWVGPELSQSGYCDEGERYAERDQCTPQGYRGQEEGTRRIEETAR